MSEAEVANYPKDAAYERSKQTGREAGLGGGREGDRGRDRQPRRASTDQARGRARASIGPSATRSANACRPRRPAA